MKRRAFSKTCIICLAGSMIPPVVSGCRATYYTTGTIEANGISVSKSEFSYLKKDRPMIREYIIVRNESLTFPIYLYRFSDEEYSALLMKCTHQGAELNAAGDHLHCPSHGSEFDSKGTVSQGPAEENLKSFKVLADNEKIFIDLRS